MSKLAAALACVLMCACDDVESSEARLLVAGDDAGKVEHDAGLVPQEDAALPVEHDAAVVASAEQEDAAQLTADASTPDAARVPRTDLVEADVRVITDQLCVNCHHVAGAATVKPWLDGTAFPDVEQSPCGMQYISAVTGMGYPEMSRLLTVFRPELVGEDWPDWCRTAHPAIEHAPTESQLDTIADWIRAGATQ